MSLMPKTTDSSTAKNMAEQLRQALSDKNALKHRSISIKAWSAEFVMLLNQQPETEVQSVLEWYAKNINRHERIPQAYSARSFRLKFLSIVAAKKISEDKGNVNDIKVSDRAAHIAKRLRIGYQWPKGSSENLPQLCELSLQRLQHFRQVVYDYSIKIKDGVEIVPPGVKWGSDEYWTRRFAQSILNTIYGLDDYVVEWFGRQSRRYSGWPDWDGKLKPIRIDGKQFQAEMMTISWNRSNSNQLWFKLWDAIKENM